MRDGRTVVLVMRVKVMDDLLYTVCREVRWVVREHPAVLHVVAVQTVSASIQHEAVSAHVRPHGLQRNSWAKSSVRVPLEMRCWTYQP